MSVRTVPSDALIEAELVAELIACSRVPPFRFGICYDAKSEPARVTVHKVVKNGTTGEVEFKTEKAARQWCTDALRQDYTVERLIGRDTLVSATVARRRRMYEQKIKYLLMTQAERHALDDEIPF